MKLLIVIVLCYLFQVFSFIPFPNVRWCVSVCVSVCCAVLCCVVAVLCLFNDN